MYSNNLKFTNDKGKLVTYADEAETLGKLKGEFQSKLDNKTSDRRSKDSANRMISSLNGKLDVLFNTQEASKPITNQQQVDTTTQLADGGNLKPKGLATIPTNDFQVGNLNPINAPASNTDLTFGQQFKQGVNTFDYAGLANNSAMFLDNIYNARLIRQTPKVAKPELLTPAKLKTNVNVNAELNVIDESIRDFSTGVARTTSNSNVANARRLAAVGQGIKARGPIFSAKRRAETALKNQSAINAQRVEAGNLGLINQFNKDVVDRQRGILEAKSANVADASGNIQTIFENKQKAAFQDKQLKLNQVINGDSEAWVRTLDSGSYDGYYRNDPSAAKNDYDRLKLNGRVQDAEKLKLHVGQLGINVINW